MVNGNGVEAYHQTPTDERQRDDSGCDGFNKEGGSKAAFMISAFLLFPEDFRLVAALQACCVGFVCVEVHFAVVADA